MSTSRETPCVYISFLTIFVLLRNFSELQLWNSLEDDTNVSKHVGVIVIQILFKMKYIYIYIYIVHCWLK